MSDDINSVSLLVRREIEALIAVPLIKAFKEEFGEERTVAVVKKVLAGLARDNGKLIAELIGGNALEDLEKLLPLFSQGGAMDFDPPEKSDDAMKIDIKRCAYAEMYQKHGLQDFGVLLSCSRDFPLFEGFNPDIEFKRTQTIMEGADHCDFRFSKRKPKD